MRTRVLGGALLAAVTGLLFAGCEGTTGPLATDDGPGGPDGEASPTQNAGIVTFGLSASGGDAAASVSGRDLRFSSVGLELIESIDVTVDRIEVHRTDDGEEGEEGEGGEGGGGWTSIPLDPPLELDLLGLSDGEMVELATEELAAGEYNGLRFFFSEATITFAEEYDPSGPAGPFPAGEPIPLDIPSGEQTGIKVPGAAFDVAGGEESTVESLFDEGASVGSLTVTGSGVVKMSPVLKPGDGAGTEGETEGEEEGEGETTTSQTGTGTAGVALSRLGGSDADLAMALVAHDGRFASVDLEDVESITLTVDRVEVHRQGDDDSEEDEETEEGEEESGEEGEEGEMSASMQGNPAWISLTVEVGELDLLALPVEGGLMLTAMEEVPAGEYRGVRLFFSDATITFAEPQPAKGNGDDLPAGEPIPLDIPSGEQTGVKVPDAGFTVEEGGGTTAVIEFDEGTTVRNLTITGNGTVKMNPVLKPGDEEEEEPIETT